MIGLLLGKARLWLIGLAAAIAALIAAYTRGRKDARDKADKKTAGAYAETRGRADEVVISDDTGVLRDLMRSRDPRKP